MRDYSNVVERYENEHLSVGDLAKEHGVSRQAMWATLRSRGCKFRPQKQIGPENHFHRGGKTFSDPCHNKVEKALKRGEITRPEACEDCGATGTMKNGRTIIQAHHVDYNKPLEVNWLCQRCHHKWHRYNVAIPQHAPLPATPRRRRK